MKKSLKLIISTPFLIIAFLAISSLSYLAYSGAKESVLVLTNKLAMSNAESVKYKLTELLEMPKAVAKINSNNFNAGLISLEYLFNKPQEYFLMQHEEFKEIDDIYFGRYDGAIVGVDKSPNGYIYKITTDFPNRNFYKLDINGTVGEVVKTQQYDATTRDWFKLAREKGGAIWSDAHLFKNKDALGITAASPVYNIKGEFVGAFGVNITLGSLSEYLKKIKISKNSTTYILDRKGMLVATSDKQKLYIDINATDKKRIFVSDAQDEIIAKSYKKLLQDIGSLDVLPSDNTLEMYLDDDNYIINVSNYCDASGIDWIIVNAISKADFMGDVYNLIEKFIIIGVVIFIILLFIAFAIANKIVSPISELARTATNTANGNFGGILKTKAVSSELNSLISSFNTMSKQLKDYFANITKLNQELEQKVIDRTTQIKTLLDNADQGFLSFSDDFLVHPEYSIMCNDIFGDNIALIDISSLLFKEESDRAKFKETIISLIGDEDAIRVETMLSLLPKEFNINSKIITAEYKMVANSDFMIILTDITEKRALEKKLDKEQKVLKMVVSSVASTSELFELLKEYKEFMANRVNLIDVSKTPLNNLTELYRAVHTFKGNFAQKDFIVTPQGLHKLETRLSKFLSDPNTTNEAVIAVLKKVELEDWLDKDLNILKQVLGDDFFDDESKIVISNDKIEELKEKIKNRVGEFGIEEHMLDALILEIEFLKQKSLYEAMLPYAKTVEQVALKLEKSVYPMHIECDRHIFLDDKYKPFIRSLVHVFRNSIDHGLEYPDVRAENGKDEFGTITCVGSIGENKKLQIVIADDGAGINIQKVANKAIENGICTQEEIDKMSDNEIAMLIFSDNFSTKDEVSELSGRGVGLAAVKAELEALGGDMSIATIKGRGTTFIFNLAFKEA